MSNIAIVIFGIPLLLIVATIIIARRSRNLVTLGPLILALLSAAYFGWQDVQTETHKDRPMRHTLSMVPVYLMMSSVPAIIAVCFLGRRTKP
jgi:uncharacterized membrane protein YidH (DUF202 family)